ncbi:unnamed protein product, partial [Rotaria sp. Silwood1]
DVNENNSTANNNLLSTNISSEQTIGPIDDLVLNDRNMYRDQPGMKTGTNQSKRFHSYAYLIATSSQALTGFKVPVRLKTAHILVIQYAAEG